MSDFNIKDLDDTDVSQIINNKSVVEVSEQLSSAQSMKLTNFTHIQRFTKTSLVKLILVFVFLKQQPKLRLSSHDLMIERGRYLRPVIPRNQRVCLNCEQQEDEIDFMLFCSKILLFQPLNIHTHDLRPNTVEVFTVFSKLLNQMNEKEAKDICNYISNAMMVRKVAKIRNQSNQVPHLTQDTTWESDKNTIKHHKQEARGQPFPSR